MKTFQISLKCLKKTRLETIKIVEKNVLHLL